MTYCDRIPVGLILLLVFLSGGLKAEEGPTGRQEQVIFADYPSLAETSEVSRRGQSPLTSDKLLSAIARNNQRLVEQQLVPQEERFMLYVPATMPPDGYALLVFIPPWDKAWLPPGWDNILRCSV